MTTDNVSPPRKIVLVVDDEPLNIRVAHRLLKDDYDLLMATSGEDAVSICEQSRPDLVLMDVVMPGLDGLAACRGIHALAEGENIPVVLVSGQSESDREQLLAQSGATDLITKPVDPDRLLSCVRQLLSRA